MSLLQSLSRPAAAVLGVAVLVAACSPEQKAGSNVTAVSTLSNGIALDLPGDGVMGFERLEVCKVWSDGTVGTNTDLDVTVADPGQAGVTNTVTLAANECREVASFDGTTAFAGPADLTVTETVPANSVLDSIVVESGNRGAPSTFTTLTGVNTWSFNDADNANGFLVTFYNSMIPPPPPPGGGEGCTPGYWKQPHHFDSWVSYSPGDSFDAVFGVSSSFATLLDALEAKGGGENALARHAVAALLNADSSVDYDLSVAEVIAEVQAAYASGDFETSKNLFAGYNEQGCPLN